MINRKYWEEQAAELLKEGCISLIASALESAVRVGRRDEALQERVRITILIRDYARDVDDETATLLKAIEGNIFA